MVRGKVTATNIGCVSIGKRPSASGPMTIAETLPESAGPGESEVPHAERGHSLDSDRDPDVGGRPNRM
ncbi:MAG: hypothetical protein NTNFB02_08120 [Nitrospira sp.]